MPSEFETAITDQSEYGTVITNQGAAIIADCILRGKKLPIVEAGAGDGGGAPTVPVPGQTALVNERWRGEIVGKELNPATPNMIDVKIVIGDDVGGFTIREMGLFSDAGVLIAVCNTPDTEKVSISEGVSGKLTMIMHIVVADASVLDFVVTPALDAMSREDLEGALTEHDTDPGAHLGLLDRMRGIEEALNGSETISGDGDPTGETKGMKGQHYINSATGKEFVCTGVTEDGCIWEPWETVDKSLFAVQPKLTGRRGQVVGFDASGAAAAVEGWSNWNFVDNGGFDLWRNGTALDADGWMCTADRWNNDSQKCRYERVDNPFPDCQCRYAMKVTNLADGQWASICQPIEPDLAAALDGRTVTLSVWVMGQSDQKFGIRAGTVSEGRVFSLSDQPQRVSVTGVFRDQADKSLNRILTLIDGPAGAKAGDWYIAAGLKLELGDAATPYTPRGMPLEYAVCSQYSPITGEWDGFRHSNLNLLDNWYLADPINQMGQTVYTGVGYTIDRWRSEGDLRVTLEDGWLKVANETDSVGWFVQFAEPSLLKALAGKTVTRSALCKVEGVSASMYYGYTDNGVWISPIDVRIPADGNAHITQLTHLTPDTTNPTTFQSMCFCLAAHSTLWIKAAKLELGCQQTLARQDAEGNWVLNDPPPDKGLELLKCQRYFQVFSSSALRPAKAGDFRPPMRANPALGTIVIDGVTYYTADANL